MIIAQTYRNKPSVSALGDKQHSFLKVKLYHQEKKSLKTNLAEQSTKSETQADRADLLKALVVLAAYNSQE